MERGLRHIPHRHARAAALLAAVAFGCVDIGVPSWSPDGRRIAFTRVTGGPGAEVRLLDFDTDASPRKLAADAYRPRWSPDGSRVFYLASGERGVALRSCKPDGTGVRDHVPASEETISWYGPAPAGRSVYYLRSGTGDLQELDLETGRARRLLPEDKSCLAAAVDPAGRLLACAVPAKDRRGTDGFGILIVELEGEERVRTLEHFVPLAAAADGARPARLTLLFRPPGRELAAFADPRERITLIPTVTGRPRTLRAATGGTVVCASVSPEGDALHLTTYAEVEGVVRYVHQRVDLETGKAVVVVDDSPVFVGGLGWAPGGIAVAEYTPRGLRISSAEGSWHYPVGAEESLREAEALVESGELREAAALLARAVAEAEPGADLARLVVAESDACWKMGEGRDAIQALLRAHLLYPVTEVDTEEVAARAKDMKGDRLLDVLKRAFGRPPEKRADLLVIAKAGEGNPALVAGLAFRAGEAYLEAGRHVLASKQFRGASEAAEFPAADYAAGLASLAYFASARNDSYAVELMQKARDYFPNSPLRGDFRAAIDMMRAGMGRALVRSNEVSHESGAAAWLTTFVTRTVRWSLGPTRVAGDAERRRLWLESTARSSLYVARAGDRQGRPVFPEVNIGVGHFTFSPQGDALAFLVEGEVAGFDRPVLADVCVIDLAGRPIVKPYNGALTALGFALASLDDRPRPPQRRITGLSWDEPGSSLILRVERMDNGRPVTGSERVKIPGR